MLNPKVEYEKSLCCLICHEPTVKPSMATMDKIMLVQTGVSYCCYNSYYHKECLRKWVLVNKKCPVCKKDHRYDEVYYMGLNPQDVLQASRRELVLVKSKAQQPPQPLTSISSSEQERYKGFNYIGPIKLPIQINTTISDSQFFSNLAQIEKATVIIMVISAELNICNFYNELGYAYALRKPLYIYIDEDLVLTSRLKTIFKRAFQMSYWSLTYPNNKNRPSDIFAMVPELDAYINYDQYMQELQDLIASCNNVHTMLTFNRQTLPPLSYIGTNIQSTSTINTNINNDNSEDNDLNLDYQDQEEQDQDNSQEYIPNDENETSYNGQNVVVNSNAININSTNTNINSNLNPNNINNITN
jgi:hypothetical protein